MKLINKIILYITLLFIYTNSYAAVAWSDNTNEQTWGFLEVLWNIFTVDLLFKIIFAIVSIIFTLIISKLIKTKFFDYLESKSWSDEDWREEMIAVITRSINVIILLLWFTVTLSILGVDLGIFIWWIWFWIWFTLKWFLTNFVAWIMIVTQWAYHVWDIVTVLNKTWTIKKIYSLYTSIEQFDWVIFNIPNIAFMEEPVTNFYTNDKRRVEIDVWVDYSTDLVKAKKIMLQISESFPYILKAPHSDIFIQEFWDNWIKLSLRFWINSKDNFFEIKSNVTETINHMFKVNWIKVAFSQVVLSTRVWEEKLKEIIKD